jgi:hypothetical protein
MYYVPILVAACLTSIIILAIVLTTYAMNIKKDFNDQMRDVVDQINTAQYYQYELDKQSYDKLRNLDTNVNNVRSSYIPRGDLTNKLVTNILDVKNIKQHDGSIDISNGALDFGNNIIISNKDNNIETNLPLGTSMTIKNGAGENIVNVDQESMFASSAKVNKIEIGDKYLLSGIAGPNGEDNWIKFLNKEGNDYTGGLALGNLWTRDNAFLNGTTTIKGQTNISGNVSIEGGLSEHNFDKNPTEFLSSDGKNYIRGDTNIDGNTINKGDLNIERDLTVTNKLKADNIRTNRIQIGYNWGKEGELSPFSVFADGDVGVAIGGPEYLSHFGLNGNTYIRPPKTNGKILIGDIGNTSTIDLGDRHTLTNVKGKFCIQDICINRDELSTIKNSAKL